MLLRDYMTYMRLSDGKFAVKLGVTKSAVSHWRRGQRIPGPLQMASIVRATGGRVTANDFYAQHDASTSCPPSPASHPAGDALAEAPDQLGQLPAGAPASASAGSLSESVVASFPEVAA